MKFQRNQVLIVRRPTLSGKDWIPCPHNVSFTPEYNEKRVPVGPCRPIVLLEDILSDRQVEELYDHKV